MENMAQSSAISMRSTVRYQEKKKGVLRYTRDRSSFSPVLSASIFAAAAVVAGTVTGTVAGTAAAIDRSTLLGHENVSPA